MNILVIGGGQFIGKYVVLYALAQGHSVTVFNRGNHAIPPQVKHIKGDVKALPQHKKQLQNAQYDAVIHCIAYSPEDANQLLETFEGQSPHLVVLSSADCYAAFQDLVRGKENSDFPLDETMDISPIPYYWRDIMPDQKRSDYDKNLMTERLMASKANVTVLRLPMVYGPDDRQYSYRHGEIIHHLKDSKPYMVTGIAKAQTMWHFAYVENIASAIVHTLENPNTIGQVYNLGENKVRTWHRWIQLFAQAADHPLNVQVVPDHLLNQGQESPPQHLLLDVSKFQKDTGYQAPVSLDEAIKRTLHWGWEHPELLGPEPDFGAHEQALKKYQDFMAQ